MLKTLEISLHKRQISTISPQLQKEMITAKINKGNSNEPLNFSPFVTCSKKYVFFSKKSELLHFFCINQRLSGKIELIPNAFPGKNVKGAHLCVTTSVSSTAMNSSEDKSLEKLIIGIIGSDDDYVAVANDNTVALIRMALISKNPSGTNLRVGDGISGDSVNDEKGFLSKSSIEGVVIGSATVIKDIMDANSSSFGSSEKVTIKSILLIPGAAPSPSSSSSSSYPSPSASLVLSKGVVVLASDGSVYYVTFCINPPEDINNGDGDKVKVFKLRGAMPGISSSTFKSIINDCKNCNFNDNFPMMAALRCCANTHFNIDKLNNIINDVHVYCPIGNVIDVFSLSLAKSLLKNQQLINAHNSEPIIGAYVISSGGGGSINSTTSTNLYNTNSVNNTFNNEVSNNDKFQHVLMTVCEEGKEVRFWNITSTSANTIATSATTTTTTTSTNTTNTITTRTATEESNGSSSNAISSIFSSNSAGAVSYIPELKEIVKFFSDDEEEDYDAKSGRDKKVNISKVTVTPVAATTYITMIGSVKVNNNNKISSSSISTNGDNKNFNGSSINEINENDNCTDNINLVIVLTYNKKSGVKRLTQWFLSMLPITSDETLNESNVNASATLTATPSVVKNNNRLTVYDIDTCAIPHGQGVKLRFKLSAFIRTSNNVTLVTLPDEVDGEDNVNASTNDGISDNIEKISARSSFMDSLISGNKTVLNNALNGSGVSTTTTAITSNSSNNSSSSATEGADDSASGTISNIIGSNTLTTVVKTMDKEGNKANPFLPAPGVTPPLLPMVTKISAGADNNSGVSIINSLVKKLSPEALKTNTTTVSDVLNGINGTVNKTSVDDKTAETFPTDSTFLASNVTESSKTTDIFNVNTAFGNKNVNPFVTNNPTVTLVSSNFNTAFGNKNVNPFVTNNPTVTVVSSNFNTSLSTKQQLQQQLESATVVKVIEKIKDEVVNNLVKNNLKTSISAVNRGLDKLINSVNVNEFCGFNHTDDTGKNFEEKSKMLGRSFVERNISRLENCFNSGGTGTGLNLSPGGLSGNNLDEVVKNLTQRQVSFLLSEIPQIADAVKDFTVSECSEIFSGEISRVISESLRVQISPNGGVGGSSGNNSTDGSLNIVLPKITSIANIQQLANEVDGHNKRINSILKKEKEVQEVNFFELSRQINGEVKETLSRAKTFNKLLREELCGLSKDIDEAKVNVKRMENIIESKAREIKAGDRTTARERRQPEPLDNLIPPQINVLEFSLKLIFEGKYDTAVSFFCTKGSNVVTGSKLGKQNVPPPPLPNIEDLIEFLEHKDVKPILSRISAELSVRTLALLSKCLISNGDNLQGSNNNGNSYFRDRPGLIPLRCSLLETILIEWPDRLSRLVTANGGGIIKKTEDFILIQDVFKEIYDILKNIPRNEIDSKTRRSIGTIKDVLVDVCNA